MTNSGISEEDIYRFIFDKIDTVPHLEALLLLWNSRPKQWTEAELTKRLFVSADTLRDIIQDLIGQQLIAADTRQETQWYCYKPASTETDDLIAAVGDTYRRELVRISRAIHSKASSGARDFGRAFKFIKGTD